MRILHVLDHVRNVGNGIVNAAVDLACAQAADGHRVAVASGGGDYEPLLARCGVAHRRLVRRDSPAGRLGVIAGLLGIVHRFRPDIVNAHRPYAAVAARLIRPIVPFALVATDHNEFEAKGRYVGLADLIIAVSDGAADALVATGVDRRQIHVVQNGPLFGARQTLVDPNERAELAHPAIVTVAGLVKRKGVDVVLDAFARVAATRSDAHLYYVGDGPEREALEHSAHAAGLADRVHVEGFQRDPGRYLRAADVCVLASRRDPFPLAALEARGAGSALVVSDVDGLPESVDHGRAGVLVAPGDADALGAALEDLLGDPERVARLRRESAQGAERFSAARMARDTEAVYRVALLARA